MTARRQLMWLICLTAGLGLCAVGCSSAKPERDFSKARQSNLVFIMADDLGCDWFSCYGSSHQTPNIDRLAAEGVRFETAWCTPICTPTRIQLLTGRYPFRTGWTDHHDVPRWGGKGFDWEREISFARLLREAGYATAIGGKWQVNDLRTHPDALRKHGFDEHCVWPGYETGNAPPSDERYWDAYLQTNGKRQIHTNQFGPDVIHAFVKDFIRRNRDRPFLAYYPLTLPHSPYVPTPLNKSNPPKSHNDLYAGMVSYVDHLVGDLAQTVERLGLSERTMIIFTCDNGSSVGGNRHGNKYPAGKGHIANCGAQVPLVVKAPWLTPGGRVAKDLVDFTDFFPTFAALAGAPLPNGVTLDGRSTLPLLKGNASAAEKREWIYSQRGGKRTVRDQRFKLDSSGAFYDLAGDALEKNDLAQSADPELTSARQRLTGVLNSFLPNAPAPFAGYLRTEPGAQPQQ